jgi:two-component system, OmpR family, phosphate regulon sensor histidine kinase PhoR
MDPHASLMLAWLLAVLGAGVSIACVTALRRERAALADVTRAARRLLAGDTHVVAPLAPGGPGELARLVNELAQRVRTEHIRIHPDRMFEQAMLRQTPNGLLVVDGRGVIRAVNPAARSLIDWPVEPVGAVAATAVPLPDFVAVLHEASETRQLCERGGHVGDRDVLFRGLPLADGGGTLGVVLDITTSAAAERVRRQFIANVSHEIRTPVTAIVGFAESLDNEALPESARALIAPLVRNALRLNSLCDDVLSLSKLEARVEDFPLETDDVLPLVGEIVGEFATRAAARRIGLALEAVGPVPARFHTEPLRAALQNLLDNALKYTPAGGSVAVRVAAAGSSVEIAVVDTGPGIAAEHHPRLFERFYRVDAGRSRDAGGTGLGLALVKHYCRAMEAEVAMASTVGEGSTFTIRLPGPE